MLETKSTLKLGPFKENVTKLQQRSSRKPTRPKVKNTWCHYPRRPAEDGRGSYWNLQTEEVEWRERRHPGASGELKKHRFPVWAWPPFCPSSSLLSRLLVIQIQQVLRGHWDAVRAGRPPPGRPRARWTGRSHGGWRAHSSASGCLPTADVPMESSTLPPDSLTLFSKLMKSGIRPS